MTNRREFIVQLSLGGTALMAGSAALAAGAPMVTDADPQSKTFGYVADAAKVDKTKSPKFAAGQNCGNCALFQGKATDAAGNCPLFAGKQVAGKGWCNSYAKKA